MDATTRSIELTRRRELRRRKILQNADERLKKLTGFLKENVSHSEDACDKTSDCSSENIGNSKMDDSALEVDLTIGVKESAPQQSESLHEVDGVYQNENFPKYFLHKNKESEKHRNENKTNKEILANKCSSNSIMNYQDNNHVVNETRNLQKENESSKEIHYETSNLRSFVVIIFAMLCLTVQSSLFVVAEMLYIHKGFFRKEFSFFGLFCILEICLSLTSLRKVMPGKHIKIWLLGLQLAGVSSKVLEVCKRLMLGTLEFLTDLAMFLFTLITVASFYKEKG
ncbi:uncharacterized protein LOC124445462 [Xenia sp. Carnegie-2017]|uniref:uncharacterized protein LOC124445462 n=1 Tax=Xenia sp. Carnegie-2017 TaxID=2897299 RepID=UPI001F04FA09|nr:uncharacterized protein LOC124445462 [Xenia sp. Carnegie-2017]